jgi:hypothetical protein
LLDLLPGYSHVLIDFPQKSQKSLDFGIVPLSANLNEIKTANFVLTKNGIINGTVIDNKTLMPVPEATVRVQIASGLTGESAVISASIIKTIKTDSNGKFSFDIAAGNYDIIGQAAGYLENSTQTNAKSGEVSEIEVLLEPAGSIRGTVRDNLTNQPINKAIISLYGSGSLLKALAETDTNGNFSFPDIEPGEYNVRSAYTGFSPNTTLVNVVGHVTNNLEIYLNPTEIIVQLTPQYQHYSRGETINLTIRITNPAGTPLSGLTGVNLTLDNGTAHDGVEPISIPVTPIR